MFPLNFEKSRAERFLQCLATGEPIGKVHTIDEMVGLAGACFFALMSHGPIIRKMAAEMQGKELETPQTQEHAEADDEMIFSDLHAAIEFSGHLTMMVKDGLYDDRCEELVRCFVSQDGDQKQLHQFEGFKDPPPQEDASWTP